MKIHATPLLATLCLLALPFTTSAASIILPDPIGAYGRQAALSGATHGGFGSGNAQAGDIAAIFGGSWTKVGDVNSDNGLSNGFLTITMSQSWDQQPVITGTWTLSPTFWTVYGSAVISMHVGNAKDTMINEPDHFAWLITPGLLQGTWSYDVNNGKGGGLSNLGLWGSGTPTTRVPEGGLTALLLGGALLALGARARRRQV